MKNEMVEWLLPAGDKSRVHVASALRAEDGRAIPLCQRRPFAWGCEEGRGMAAAEATGRELHARCWALSGLIRADA